jgi:uncharacterized repeat protein (TIGR03803 family)
MTQQGRTTRNVFVTVAVTLLLAVSALAQDSEIVLHTFTGGKDGGDGGTQLVSDSVGNLYGTTFAGGDKSASCELYTGLPGCGVVFKLAPNGDGSWKETVLHTFTGGKDGGIPTSGVILDSAGNLYGAALFGGERKPGNCRFSGFPPGCGVIYKLTPTAHGPWTQTVLYTVTGGTDGFEPWDRLIFDSSGNLYGTAGGGGDLSCNPPYGCGAVFELSPGSGGSWAESVLYAFSADSDGESPFSGVIFDSQGNLYGTTLYGGDTSVSCNGVIGCGVIFQLTPTPSGPWTETVLHAFTDGPDGAYPLFNVILDSTGNVYGSTLYGGDTTSYDCRGGVIPGCGVVYKLTPTAHGPWTQAVLYTFTGGKDGVWPISPLVFDPSGNLYGVTRYGGGIGNGMVYKLTPAGQGPWIQTNLYAFDGGHDGAEPESNLVFDSSGNLYGMTNNGGNRTECNRGGCGVVFELQQP